MTCNKKQNQTHKLIASHLQTPLGTMLAVTDETHLYILKFIDQNNVQAAIEQLQQKTNCTIIEDSNDVMLLLQQELTAYFNGTLQKFSILIHLYGTTFQQKSWQALTEIPYGYTISYGQQAVVVGNAKAYRAVANANRNNPIAIIVPCHRIIKSNGDLCGYNGGVHRKQALLELEKMFSLHHIKSV